jgi:hypothetical protein
LKWIRYFRTLFFRKWVRYSETEGVAHVTNGPKPKLSLLNKEGVSTFDKPTAAAATQR